uniref:Uncharacterized protein n=1 Tax=viral metagenome TaxID=1070528 RepID=A0A6M3KYM3_9ZZZZ
MGELTLSEMRERTKFQFGNNDEFDSVGSSATNFYNLWINTAYRQLTTYDYFWGKRRAFRFPQLDTSTTAATVDGTAYISVPSGTLVIQHVYDTTNDYYLTNIPYSEYVKYSDRSDTTAEGEPSYWTRSGTYVYLYPTPDDAYTMRVYYRAVPDDLSTDASTTTIGKEWDDIIVQLAVYTGKKYTGEFEAAKVLRGDIDDMISSMVSIYGQEEKSRVAYLHLDPMYRERGY